MRQKIQKPKTPERAILKALKTYLTILEKQGRIVFWTRVQSGNLKVGKYWVKMGRTGSPDIIAMLPHKDGKLLAIETKGTGGKLSEEQFHLSHKILNHGGAWITCWSVDDFEQKLQRLEG